MSLFSKRVYNLLQDIELNQYRPRNFSALIPDVPVLTREALRKIKVDKSGVFSTSSGSTGQPVTVQKSFKQRLWFKATNQRELLWRGWDVSKKMAVITAKIDSPKVGLWRNNPYLFPDATGQVHTHPLKGDLQGWLNESSCEYLHTYPSIAESLDTSKLVDVKSTGERGGTMYSCEEMGTIGIECPENPDVYHVMENIIVELDDANNIIVTDLAHPYLKRYLIGDKGEWGTCSCGRKLQTLNKDVLGRVRNMAVAADGSKFWPVFGTIKFNEAAPNLIRCQAIQTSLSAMVLKVEGDITRDEEHSIIEVMTKSLGNDYSYRIEKVSGFPEGKFEEFVCLI